MSIVADIGSFYFYQAFFFFTQLSGVIPVVAAAFTLLRLSRFNELTALLAAGTPMLHWRVPIIIAGVVLNVLLIVDQEWILPPMIPQLDAVTTKCMKTPASSAIRSRPCRIIPAHC